MSDPLLTAWTACRNAIAGAADGRSVRLLAVGKGQPAARIRALADLGQREFGENYLSEALDKIAACADLNPVWHFIGPLQSNKCRDIARHFDWLQSLDRRDLVDRLSRHRPDGLAPLNVLIQVNVDGEQGKRGCPPAQLADLAAAVAAQPALRLRGLMAIPRPDPDVRARRKAFARMHALFRDLQQTQPMVDTLSMGMSDDFALAIAEGSTMVRVGTALFGSR